MDRAPTTPPVEAVEVINLSAVELGDARKAKDILSAFAGYTVVCGGGILDSAPTLVAASAVDGAVLVARVGRTDRSDLSAARAEIERAGGTILGAILLP
jgi:hypothetical protein